MPFILLSSPLVVASLRSFFLLLFLAAPIEFAKSKSFIMNKIQIYFIALLALCTIRAEAQDLKIPQPSTLQQIEQDFGLGQITITYSRPNVKGRKIFGEIEPYVLANRR
jgi:hypothetical protein